MRDWWRHAVFYEIYVRSFQDSNGDGVGDLEGITRRLDYLNDGTSRSLGVDALWLTPINPSPMYDFGYDVSDYCAVDPLFGTIGDLDRLIGEAHRRNIRIILEYLKDGNMPDWEVPNMLAKYYTTTKALEVAVKEP